MAVAHSRRARGPCNGTEVGGWVGAPSGAGVEMTGTGLRAAGCLGLTRVGGGSTRRAELARTGQRKPSGGHKKPARVRAPAYKDSQRGVV